MAGAEPVESAAVKTLSNRIGTKTLSIDEVNATDVNISIMEEGVVGAAPVSIDAAAEAVMMTSTDDILVTTLVTVLVTSTFAMGWVSLITETAAESDGTRLSETNVDFKRLDGLKETTVPLG